MKYFITGDTHGRVIERLQNFPIDVPNEETALIILGDAGLNFYLNKTDKKEKQKVQDSGVTVYCVRGNHEERPQNIKGMIAQQDLNVGGLTWQEPQYPNIRYLIDGFDYTIDGHSVLVIGGAYSVDKYYRLERAKARGQSDWTGWFKDEQLTVNEMEKIVETHAGKSFDLILSHTCPYNWRPTDLFLSGLDQSTVDNTMEFWMQDFKDKIDWKVWLFGHYHADRLVRPNVEMYYKNIEELDTIWNRWTGEKKVDWWLPKDPNYYIDEREKL